MTANPLTAQIDPRATASLIKHGEIQIQKHPTVPRHICGVILVRGIIDGKALTQPWKLVIGPARLDPVQARRDVEIIKNNADQIVGIGGATP